MMIQVYFKKSPTGAPFFLAYSKGEHGFVTRQKAELLMEYGVIDPVDFGDSDALPSEAFVTTDELEEVEQTPDMATEAGVKSLFGADVEAMQDYCDEHGIKYGRSAKRPEYFYAKIAKHNRK